MKKLIANILLALTLAFGLGAPTAAAQSGPTIHMDRAHGMGGPIRRLPVATDNLPPPSGAAISLEEARNVFAIMKAQPDITFENRWDGCWARAHAMHRRMQGMGIESQYVYARGARAGIDFLEVRLENGQIIRWSYHVAPVVNVLLDGTPTWMVIDPSLCAKPVTLDEWRSKQQGFGRPAPRLDVVSSGMATLRDGWRTPTFGMTDLAATRIMAYLRALNGQPPQDRDWVRDALSGRLPKASPMLPRGVVRPAA